MKYPLALTLIATLISSACITVVDMNNRACPCTDGYTCCEDINLCIAPGQSCKAAGPSTSASDASADARVGRSLKAYCDGEIAWQRRCLPDASSPTCDSSLLSCTMAMFEPSVLDAIESCFETRACDKTEESCRQSVYGDVVGGGDQVFALNCQKKYSECSSAGSALPNPKLCEIPASAFQPAVKEAFAACLGQSDCQTASTCVRSMMEQRGCQVR